VSRSPAYLTSEAIFTRTLGIVPLFAWRASARWCKTGPPALTFAWGAELCSATVSRSRRRDGGDGATAARRSAGKSE